MESIEHDVVRVLCHTHPVGVGAEHAWLARQYPKWNFVQQGLSSLEYLTNETGKPKSFFDSSAFFDLIVIRNEQGRTKQVFFDITSFFTKLGTSTTNPTGFMAEKLRGMYETKTETDAGTKMPRR
jgi:hypothetical protein